MFRPHLADNYRMNTNARNLTRHLTNALVGMVTGDLESADANLDSALLCSMTVDHHQRLVRAHGQVLALCLVADPDYPVLVNPANLTDTDINAAADTIGAIIIEISEMV